MIVDDRDQTTNAYVFRPSWSSSAGNHHAFITKPKPQSHLRPPTQVLSTTTSNTHLAQEYITTKTTPTPTPVPTSTTSTTTTPAPPPPPPLPPSLPSTSTGKPLVISTVSTVVAMPTVVPGKPEKHTAKPGVSAENNQKSTRTSVVYF